MFVNEGFAQCGDRGSGRPRQEQLIGIRPPVLSDRDGFPTPDQLGAAPAEVAPAPFGQIARTAAGVAVPTFHGKDAETIAHTNAVERKRIRQRRASRIGDLVVQVESDVFALEMRSERGG